MSSNDKLMPWEPSKCRVPMWMGGCPSGHCDAPAFGPQYPLAYIKHLKYWADRPAYCFGHACPDHDGPKEGDPIIFEDGTTPEGRQMWCAVMPGFVNLQESPAGFSGDPAKAVANLRAAIAKAAA
jgi:hypothetical protein